MGNVLVHDFPYDNESIRKFKSTFEALQLRRKEVARLYRIFTTYDEDKNGTISINEFMDHLRLGQTVFRDRVFSIFDSDRNGKVDFKEFVLALWNYCTLSRATLDLFTFDLYDTDSTGELSNEEIFEMLHDLYGSGIASNQNALHVIHELAKSPYAMDVDRFRSFAQTHPSVLFPAFQLQHLLRKRILGVGFWESASNRRIEVTQGKYIPIARFVELNVNEHAYEDNVTMALSVTKRADLVLKNTGTHHYRSSFAQSNDTVDTVESLKESPLRSSLKDSSKKHSSPPAQKFEKFSQKKTLLQRLADTRFISQKNMYEALSQNSVTKYVVPPEPRDISERISMRLSSRGNSPKPPVETPSGSGRYEANGSNKLIDLASGKRNSNASAPKRYEVDGGGGSPPRSRKVSKEIDADQEWGTAPLRVKPLKDKDQMDIVRQLLLNGDNTSSGVNMSNRSGKASPQRPQQSAANRIKSIKEESLYGERPHSASHKREETHSNSPSTSPIRRKSLDEGVRNVSFYKLDPTLVGKSQHRANLDQHRHARELELNRSDAINIFEPQKKHNRRGTL